MVDLGVVRSEAEHVVPIVVAENAVSVRTDIRRVSIDDINGEDGEAGGNGDSNGNDDYDGNGIWEYHEVQYGKDEYIQLMAEQNVALASKVTSAQLAMCELYERITRGRVKTWQRYTRT